MVHRQSRTLLILLTLVAACATTPPEPPVFPAPSDWAVDLDTSRECAPISGVFDNLGVKQAENGIRTVNGLLSRDVLTRTAHGGGIPDRVAIYSDTEINQLNAELHGGVNRKIGMEVLCQGGWHLFSFERSGNYLGNNVQEIYFRQQTWLRQDRMGRLVARTVQSAEYEIRFSERTTESSENWFRFEKAP